MNWPWAMDEQLDENCILVHEYQQSSQQFFTIGPGEHEKKWVFQQGSLFGLGGWCGYWGKKSPPPIAKWLLNIGDGSVMYSAAGFWTMARYEVPVLTIVSNNHSYDSVRINYAAYNGRMKAANRFTGTILDNPQIDFVGLAKAEGCDGIRVEKAADLRPGLKARDPSHPCWPPQFLIDVEVARTGPGADSTWYQKFSVAPVTEKEGLIAKIEPKDCSREPEADVAPP